MSVFFYDILFKWIIIEFAYTIRSSARRSTFVRWVTSDLPHLCWFDFELLHSLLVASISWYSCARKVRLAYNISKLTLCKRRRGGRGLGAFSKMRHCPHQNQKDGRKNEFVDRHNRGKCTLDLTESGTWNQDPFSDKTKFHWSEKKLYCRKFDFFINARSNLALFCTT